MRFAFTLLGLGCLLFLFQYAQVNAFTIGTMLPSYICGPTDATAKVGSFGDNYPRSLAGWLKFIGMPAPVFAALGPLPMAQNTEIGRMTNGFVVPNALSGALNDPAVRVDYATDAGTVNNTKSLISNWHNRALYTGCINTIFVSVALTNQPTVTGTIVPAQNHTITLTVNGQDGNPDCNVYTTVTQVQPADIENVALDGAVVYAVLRTAAAIANPPTAPAPRVGSFLAFGPADATTMEAWPACGANNIGIVHNQLISDTGRYTGIIWQAPATLTTATQVAFQGAAVSDVGFGPHQTIFSVAAPATVVAQSKVKLNVAQPIITKVAEMGKNLAVFFNSQAKGATATNAIVIPTSFVVQATVAGAAAGQVTVKQGSVALLPITAAMKGQTVAVTVTASNNDANSIATTSGTFSIAVKPGTKNAAISLEVVLALCPADEQKQRAMYQEDLDPDYQCAFQTQVLLENGTVAFIQETVIANGATQQSPALPLIALFAVALASLTSKL